MNKTLKGAERRNGDIPAACKRAGVSRMTYYNSLKVDAKDWTAGMVEVHRHLREIRVERARFVAELAKPKITEC